MDVILNRRHMFFLGLGLYILRCFFSYTSYELPVIFLTVFWYGAQLCWLMAIIMRFEWNPSIIIELALLAFGLFNYKLTESTNILAIIYMLLASKDIECSDIISVMFKWTAPLMGGTIVWYAINYALGNVSTIKTREIDGVVSLRHSFFFNHANGFSLYFLFFCLMIFYLSYYKYSKIILYTMLLLGSVFIYVFPNTRTVSLVTVAVIVFDLLLNIESSRISRFICKNLFILGLVIVVVVVAGYVLYPQFAIFTKINKFMNGRITMVAGAYEIYGINLLGHKIINEDVFLPGLGYFTLYLDNFWGMLVIRYGVIAMVLIGTISMYTAYQLEKKKMNLEFLMVAMIFVFGLSESTALDVFPVFPWLFVKETQFYKYLESRP